MRIFVLLGLIPLCLFASENTANQAFIENNLFVTFDSLNIKSLGVSDTVNLDFGVVQGEQKGFIKNLLIRYMDQAVISSDGHANKSTIRIEQFETTIVYEQNSSGFLGLETETVRQNNISISGWIEDFNHNKRTQKSITFNKTFTDTLETGNIENLESSPYSFTKGFMKEQTIWTEIVEPVFLFTSVATVIYLFFSVRS